MLDELVKESDLTVESLTSVLNAVHQEGLRDSTLYSNIFDLKSGIAFLYDRHRYGRVAKLDVVETIKKKRPPKQIKDLFLQEKLN